MVTSALLIAFSFAAWAAVHSWLASLAVKDWARRVLGPGVERWYRLAYVGLAVLTLAPLPVLLALLPDRTLYVVPTPWRWLLVAGQVGGAIGAGVAIWQTGLFEFVGLAPLFGGVRTAGGALQVRGLYCYVRHPIYLFSMILLWLTPVMTVNLLVTYLLFMLYFYVGSLHEEQRLVAEFGEVYRRYQRRVPRFIPRRGRCRLVAVQDDSLSH